HVLPVALAEIHLLAAGREDQLPALPHLEATLLQAAGERPRLVLELEQPLAGMLPVGRPDRRAEEITVRVADLDGRVLRRRVEARRYAVRTDLQPDAVPLRPAGSGLQAKPLDVDPEWLAGAAIRVLSVDEPVAVVVDAVAADLARTALGGVRAVRVGAVDQAVAVV